MQIGYARASTVDQEAGFQAQITSLKAAGCEKVFAEQVSSLAERAQLEAALEYAREGDTLVVTKLDRLARSVFHLVTIGERLEGKGVYKGRAPTARAKAPEIRRLRGEGIGPTEIAKRLRISRASVYRAL